MIYHEKTPALEESRADQPELYPLPRPAAAREINNRPVRRKAPAAPPHCALLDKARNFKTAAQLREVGLYPYFRTISSAQDTEVMIDGKKVLMLGSNSYLGLTNHPKIKAAAQAAVEKYGTGCAGSRFLNGTLDIHLELEAALAKLVNKEAVLLYSTGFQVNLGVISALVGKGEYVFGRQEQPRQHCRRLPALPGEVPALCAQRHGRPGKPPPERSSLKPANSSSWTACSAWKATSFQLPELCRIAREHGAAIMVDDAHAIGVLGKNGAGTASHFGLTDQVHLIMGTFSKSLASLGGFIASDANDDRLPEAPFPAAHFQREHEPGQRRRRAGGAADHVAGAGAHRAALAQHPPDEAGPPRIWASTSATRKPPFCRCIAGT